jgi:hypothetical protein
MYLGHLEQFGMMAAYHLVATKMIARRSAAMIARHPAAMIARRPAAMTTPFPTPAKQNMMKMIDNHVA